MTDNERQADIEAVWDYLIEHTGERGVIDSQWREGPATQVIGLIAHALDRVHRVPGHDACVTNPVSSRMCERGTKSCDVQHVRRVPGPLSRERDAGIEADGPTKREEAAILEGMSFAREAQRERERAEELEDERDYLLQLQAFRVWRYWEKNGDTDDVAHMAAALLLRPSTAEKAIALAHKVRREDEHGTEQ